MRFTKYKYLILILFLLSACGKYSYLSKPKYIQYSTKGSYIKLKDVNSRNILSGELIAINDDKCFILTKEKLFVIQNDKYKSALIFVSKTSDDPGGITTWAGALPLTTITHGYFLIITFPINLFISIPIIINSNTSKFVIHYPGQINISEMKKFARFPQGIPDNIQNGEIK